LSQKVSPYQKEKMPEWMSWRTDTRINFVYEF
jgi:hypothetical protein